MNGSRNGLDTSKESAHLNSTGWVPALMALGIVYGDIGTSPLYAMRECFHGSAAVALTQANLLGVLSLILWSLILVISIKYLTIIMRADNRGEGGILVLMMLATGSRSGQAKHRWLAWLGLFGAGLLLGDGMITPAISVLSAVEGLQLIAPASEPYVVPLSLLILTVLFAIQYRGTAKIGILFGPVMLVWFAVLALLGGAAICNQPHVLVAVSPHYAAAFLLHNRWPGFLILGLVFLVVTGGEALYADMGHFGAKPIRKAWVACVLPALVLNYFGQGALLLEHPAAKVNPFYHLAPVWAQYPLVLLATCAAIIASQAVLSGSFSLGRQAVRFGYSPRLNICHTSSEERGQIYIPFVNWTLFVAVAGLVLSFQSSSNLAAAYGMAVTSTMVITTLLLYFMAQERWGWPRSWAIVCMSLFLVVDLAFFSANLAKIFAGGWIPLLVGMAVGLLMATWHQGRQILHRQFRAKLGSLKTFHQAVQEISPIRVPGHALYLSSHSEGVPVALLHNLKHNKVLHEQVGILTIQTENVPRVSPSERISIATLDQGLVHIIARFGFMQRPQVSRILLQCEKMDIHFPLRDTTFFLGRETIEIGRKPTMARWRKQLFVWMARNAHDASAHFGIPPSHAIEVGVQLEI